MKVTAQSYGQFLVNSVTNFTGTYFADTVEQLDHNSVYRYLKYERLTPRLVFDKAREVATFCSDGIVIFDDTVLDKSFSRQIELTRSQYSGNAHGIVRGIGVVNCVYYHPGLDEWWVLDYRIFDPDRDGKTKLDHVKEMIDQLQFHDIPFATVLMDTWYATVPLMRQIHGLGKTYYCPLKSNRLVDDSNETRPYQAVSKLIWTDEELAKGKTIHLKGLAEPVKVKLFRVTVSADRTDYVVTNDQPQKTTADAQQMSATRWKIEQFHREEKQLTGIEQCQTRLARSQRNHICLAMQAWIVLKQAAKLAGVTIYEQKAAPLKALVAELWRHPATAFA